MSARAGVWFTLTLTLSLGGCGETPVTIPLIPDPPPPPATCDTLAAADDHASLAALPRLCPGLELSRPHQRQLLLRTRDRAGLRAFLELPRLDAELRDIARLAALDLGRTRLAIDSDSPTSPVEADVLARVAGALCDRRDATIGSEERTRAEGYLARVFLHALTALGIPEGDPLPPLGRRLAERVLHHGRVFARAYWQRRVRGLASEFAEVEDGLRRTLVALDRTPHYGDSTLLAVERDRVRAYLSEPGPAGRIAGRDPVLGAAPLATPIDVVLRRLDHRFVDLALSATRVLARDGGPGLAQLEPFLEEELRRRSMGEFVVRLHTRFDQAREDPSTFATRAVPIEATSPVWPSSVEVANSLVNSLASAPGPARRHGLGKILNEIGSRPDALPPLLEDERVDARARRALAAVHIATDPWASITAMGTVPGTADTEAIARVRFALSARRDGLSPR